MNIYKMAIQVQDACNMLGVVNSLHKDILPEVHMTVSGTKGINTNPAVQLFAFKIAALATGECLCDVSMAMFGRAYDLCKERSNEK